MGQQQVLLILVGILLIGFAVAGGISMFVDDAVQVSRDAVSSDLAGLAGRAHQYYRRPASRGGGGESFAGLTADSAGLARLTILPGGKNSNGVYSIRVEGTSDEVVIEGTGTAVTSGGDHVTMRIYVHNGSRADSLVTVY